MKTKLWLKIGIIFLFAGLIIALIPLVEFDFDVHALQAENLIERVYDFDNISDISLNLRGESVEVIQNENLTGVRLTLLENEDNNRFEINTDEKGLLRVTKNSGFFLRELRFINFGSATTMIIEMPNELVDNLSISGRSGRVELIGLTFDNLEINMRSGRIDISNVVINQNLSLQASSGLVELTNVVAPKTNLGARSGNVKVTNSNFEKATFDVGSGKIEVSNTTINTLNSQARSGTMIFNNLVTSDATAEVRSGSIIMNIAQFSKNDFLIIVNLSSGRSNVNSQSPEGANRRLILTARSGRINVTFPL